MHISVHALLRGLAGGKAASSPAAAPPSRDRAEGEGPGAPSAIEALASILGPPSAKFVPPCRMLPPVQTSAPPTEPA